MKTLPSGEVRLTLEEFAARYGMGKEAARNWIEGGEAPGSRIVGSRRYLILKSHCDAYDKDPTGWKRPVLQQLPPRPATEYLRRVS